MKNLFLFLGLALLLIASCKKEEEQPVITPTNTIDLSWTQSERDTIMAGDTSLGLRIYLTTNYADSLVLRKQSINVVPDSNDVVLMTLINRMYDAMIAGGGVGIAAPQVGINRNISWVKRQDKPGRPNECYINLKISMTSILEINFLNDGCLSVPVPASGKTKRFRAVGIEYDLLDGTHVSEVVDGYTSTQFTAVCFQHEIDHLNGILYIDRIVP